MHQEKIPVLFLTGRACRKTVLYFCDDSYQVLLALFACAHTRSLTKSSPGNLHRMGENEAEAGTCQKKYARIVDVVTASARRHVRIAGLVSLMSKA